MSFTADEIAYMRTQPLARVATVDPDGQPDVVPVTFDFDGQHILIGGFEPAKTRRHHNIDAGNHHIALVVDDLASTTPWTPRYLRIYGTAEAITTPQPHLRVTPTVSWSWNLAGRPLGDGQPPQQPRRTRHTT